MTRPCYVCKAKPARKLKPPRRYAYAAAGATFCSVRCAADYGLLIAGSSPSDGLNWCKTHGWWKANEEMNGGCPDCNHAEKDQ
jgi:hypothetical protein